MNDWENPYVIGISKRKAHTPLYSFRAPDDALRRFRKELEPCGSGRVQLDGPEWQFRLFDSPTQVPARFWEDVVDEDGWHPVRSEESRRMHMTFKRYGVEVTHV